MQDSARNLEQCTTRLSSCSSSCLKKGPPSHPCIKITAFAMADTATMRASCAHRLTFSNQQPSLTSSQHERPVFTRHANAGPGFSEEHALRCNALAQATTSRIRQQHFSSPSFLCREDLLPDACRRSIPVDAGFQKTNFSPPRRIRRGGIIAAAPPTEEVMTDAKMLTKADLVAYMKKGCKPKDQWR
jgi:hypothetical protein